MAEEKKDKKPAGWSLDPIEGLILFLIFAALISSVVPMVFRYITSGSITFYGFGLPSFSDFFVRHDLFFKFLGFGVAGIAGVASIVFNKASDAIWATEKSKLFPVVSDPDPSTPVLANNETASRWKKIVELSETEIESNWRLAIIEADIILDGLLDQLRLPGDTMGEKLKAVEKSDFNTLDYAWEAHKARNMIAHEGAGFELNQRETRRIISLYEAVFREFEII